MLKSLYRKVFSERKRIQIIHFIKKITSIFYYGNVFYCNCCNRSFRKFEVHGNIPRENARCPNCLSLERTRVLWMYLQHETVLLTNKIRVLHFAPEYAIKMQLKKYSNIDYVDADINPNLATYQIDITDIPFDNESFDLIICSHVLGHVPDESKAVNELFRVLKPDGVAFIQTVINANSNTTFEDSKLITPEERLKNYGENDLVRLHGLDFIKRLEKSGFKVETIDYKKILLKTHIEIEKYSLGNGERELIFKCWKL